MMMMAMMIPGDMVVFPFIRGNCYGLLLVCQRHKVVDHQHCTENGENDAQSSGFMLPFSNITWDHYQIKEKRDEHNDCPCCMTHVGPFFYIGNVMSTGIARLKK